MWDSGKVVLEWAGEEVWGRDPFLEGCVAQRVICGPGDPVLFRKMYAVIQHQRCVSWWAGPSHHQAQGGRETGAGGGTLRHTRGSDGQRG